MSGLRIRRLLFLVAAVYLASALLIAWTGLHDTVADADLIVVPGNTVDANGEPSPRLKARLNAALRLFEAKRAALVFVSGGVGREGYDEAAVMAAYLERQGVPAAAIVQDPHGIDTAATARNASRFMREKGLRSALIASQYFHIARTRLALEREGVRVVGAVHARFREPRDLYSLAREVAGYAVYWLRGAASS